MSTNANNNTNTAADGGRAMSAAELQTVAVMIGTATGQRVKVAPKPERVKKELTAKEIEDRKAKARVTKLAADALALVNLDGALAELDALPVVPFKSVVLEIVAKN